jgi:hypothetical protein
MVVHLWSQLAGVQMWELLVKKTPENWRYNAQAIEHVGMGTRTGNPGDGRV